MPDSDEELVARIVATGDASAFEILVRRHQARVRGWLRRLAGDAAQADDLAQDTFLQTWRRIGSFDGRGRFSSWLMKIAYNVYLQARRRQGRQEQPDTDAAGGHEPQACNAVEALYELPRLLSVLSEDERAAIVLSYGYEMSHAEIAGITGMPLGTVKSHIRRAAVKIRQRFALESEHE